MEAKSQEEGLTIGLDAQFDSPGHCAANAKVSAIDVNTQLIVDAENLHRNDPGIGTAKNSHRLIQKKNKIVKNGTL